jgi:DnaJ homolog subfamily C member 7
MGGMGGMGGANINIDPNILFNMMNGGGGFPRSGGGHPFANAHSRGGFEGFEF